MGFELAANRVCVVAIVVVRMGPQKLGFFKWMVVSLLV